MAAVAVDEKSSLISVRDCGRSYPEIKAGIYCMPVHKTAVLAGRHMKIMARSPDGSVLVQEYSKKPAR